MPRDNPAAAMRVNILTLCTIAACLAGACLYSHHCTDRDHVGKEPTPSDGFRRKVKAYTRCKTCITCCEKGKPRADRKRENPDYGGFSANWSEEQSARYLKTVLTQYLSMTIHFLLIKTHTYM